ncbi:YhfX family PLP-dependent enzyme [Aeromicrobium camelliae]|uniref:YhfX family PLP-dependent enzyme n=2 Tax=Aeromicrobium camelliae TaxID=1538144 RepID=A0A3N6YFH8_9ACTN|nr:alanine racemase [Aeromicrobium camelliae]RQN08554.1 YhfX family PLP-dependent enzyme [Aeromicrobium camelliae]
MFLTMTERRNPALIDVAVALHQSGAIEPDTYVIDRDTVGANAAALAETARAHDVGLWFVSKQYGRNPLISETIAEHIPAAAAIDHREADAVLAAGARLGNLGHLVQVPRRRLPALLSHDPDFVTVTDTANLEAVDSVSGELGRRQRILLKIRGTQESTYPGQDGGFEPDAVAAVLDRYAGLRGAEIAGVTGFPCLSFEPETGRPEPTPTLDRVQAAAKAMREAGIDPVVSLPSHTSVSSIPEIARLGGAFGEPGHALTGTTPQHAVDMDLREVPALVYVSEIAQLGTAPSVFGGGFYHRGHARHVIVATPRGRRRAVLHKAPAASIDYYRRFTWVDDGPEATIGDTAVMALRTQIFVTRSRVAVVSGVGTGRPQLDGIYDPVGRRVA